MNKITKAALCMLLTIPTIGLADTNITWKSSLALGATYKGGNTEKTLYTVNLKGDRYAENSDMINSLYAETGKTEGEQTEGHVRAQSDYRYKFGGDKNMFGGVFSEGYYDDIKKVRTRVKIGPNVGNYFINKEKMKLDISIGLNYVYERTASTEDDFGEVRAAANYFWDFSETATYYLNLEYSANVEDTDDGNGLFVTGLKSKLSDQAAVFIELRDNYDNTPSSGVERHNDVTVTAGLTYDF